MIRYLLDADDLVVRPLRPREHAARVIPPGGRVVTSPHVVPTGEPIPVAVELPAGARDRGPIYLTPEAEERIRTSAGAVPLRVWIARALEAVRPDVPLEPAARTVRATPIHAWATPRAWAIVGEIADSRGAYRQDVIRGALLAAAAAEVLA
jgi:hypothetical protein